MKAKLPPTLGLFGPHGTKVAASRSNILSLREIASPETPSSLFFEKRLQLISEREGEDAALTGGTRSLHRRLLALNIDDTRNAAQTHPDQLLKIPQARIA